MRIHPVISVAQLEPIVEGNDPYSRVINAESPPVRANGDNGEENIYVIDRLLEKRVSRGTT